MEKLQTWLQEKSDTAASLISPCQPCLASPYPRPPPPQPQPGPDEFSVFPSGGRCGSESIQTLRFTSVFQVYWISKGCPLSPASNPNLTPTRKPWLRTDPDVTSTEKASAKNALLVGPTTLLWKQLRYCSNGIVKKYDETHDTLLGRPCLLWCCGPYILGICHCSRNLHSHLIPILIQKGWNNWDQIKLFLASPQLQSQMRAYYDDDAGCQYGCTFDAYLLPPGSPNCSEGALGRGQGAREGQRERRDGGGRL